MFMWLLGAIIPQIRLATSKRTRPRPFWMTPWPHRATAAWVFRYTNNERRKAGLPPFKRYLMLQSAAQGHSAWAAQNEYSHVGHKGSTPHERIKATGFPGGMTAENIQMAPAQRNKKRLARSMVDAWMKSHGHRANILHHDLNYIGVGIAQKGRWVYGTQNFGG